MLKEDKMSKVITEREIRKWINDNTIISDGVPECAEGIKYDFRFGGKFLKAYFGRVMDYKQDLKSAEDIRKAIVEPGEVVFVMSQERLKLPDNIYAQLSPKRSLSQDGIELMGGLTIDPGYEGHLVFGLRNVAGTPYNLVPESKIVAANFFELTEDEILEHAKKPKTIDEFPEQLLTLIEKYKPVNPQNLKDEFLNLKKAFENSQEQLGEGVKELKANVDRISQELISESTKREQENRALNEKFSAVENKLEGLNNESIRNAEKLNNLEKKTDAIEKNTADINNSIIQYTATNKIRGKMAAIIISIIGTFIVTVLAGWLLNFL